MAKTIEELEAENAELRRSRALLEDVVRRLLADKPGVAAPPPQPQIVPMPYPAPMPSIPSEPSLPPYYTGPWWGITPPPYWEVTPTITCEGTCGPGVITSEVVASYNTTGCTSWFQ